MAQTSLNSTGVASAGALSLQSNGTTEAIGISTGQVATLAQNPILTSGTANGVAYLNGSKAVTSGSSLVFDGTNLLVGVSSSSTTRFRSQGASTTSSDFAGYFTDSGPTLTFAVRNDGAILTGTSGSGKTACPYNNTTASAANMVVGTGGDLQRSTSALKYKQDVRDLEAIDLSLLRAVRYKSKCENDDQSKDYFGLIADEVHTAGITELVNYGADGEVEGFQYERLTAVLLKSLQEQQAIIESLTTRIELLEAN